MLYFSQTTGGFYDSDIHGADIPPDAVEISREDHEALFTGQAAGKLIVADAGGAPSLADPAAPSVEAVCDAIDSERDRRANDRFTYAGNWFQCRPQDVVNITGAGATALSTIVAGGDWPEDFAWIAEDNSHIPMTALEVIGLGNAYTAFRRNLIFRASEMKTRVRAGETVDYTAESAWAPA